MGGTRSIVLNRRWRLVWAALACSIAGGVPARAEQGASPAEANGDLSAPAYSLVFSGNDFFSDEALRRVVRRPEFEQYSRYLIEDLKDAIEDFYIERGFADVIVSGTDTAKGERRVLEFAIVEGLRYQVAEVEIEGNRAFDRESLEKLLAQRPRRRFTPYDRVTARDDRRRLIDHYVGNGYLDATVDGEERVDGTAGQVVIRHVIDEGQLYLVDEIVFSGNTIFSATELADAIPLRVQEPYSPAKGRASWARIVELYREHGFAYAAADVEMRKNDAEARVSLRYQIDEGERVTIAGIHVLGNVRTATHVIQRQLDLRTGDPYARSELFKGRGNVFRLGLFESVDIEPAAPLVGQTTTDIIVRVVEGKPGRVRFAGGYSTLEGMRGGVEIGYGNLFGLAHELGARVEATGIGNEEEIYYAVPRAFGQRFDARHRLYHSREEEPSFTVDRVGVGTMWRRQLDPEWSLRLEYGISDVELSGVKISPSIEDLRESEGVLSSGSVALIRDARDNARDPHKGALSEVQLELGGSVFGGDFDFVKTRWAHTLFVPATERSTLVVMARAGWIEPFGSSSASPLSERFLVGGDGTLRGFKRDKVGPRDVYGQYIGGDSMLLLNAEYRFPLAGKLAGAIFADVGNVWPSLDETDLGDTRENAGVGVRYLTPLGALRFDYGHVLDRRDGEDAGQFHLGIGFSF